MKISQRVVLSLLVAMLQLMAFLWASGKISIVWVIVMLWTICISLIQDAKDIIPSEKNPLNKLLTDVAINYAVGSMISMAAICYQYPNAESWNSWCHLDVLLFPNVKHMLDTILNHVFCFSLFFFRLARNVWNEISQHMWHYAKGIGGFGISVLIFLYVIDFIIVNGMSFTDSALNRGLKYRDSRPLIYPRVFEGSKYEHGHAVQYISSCTETLPFKQGNFTTLTAHQPLTYERYNGEDIKLSCSFESNVGITRHGQFYWSQNGVRLHKSEKRNPEVTITASGTHSVIISMSLTISYIDDTDYGVYSCVEETVYPISFDQTIHIAGSNTWSSLGSQVESVVKMEIHLKEQQPFVEVVHLLPTDIAFFLGHEFLTTDDSWMSYEYTINGGSYDPSFTEIAKCSIHFQLLTLLNVFLEDPYNVFTTRDLVYINGIERDKSIQDISRYVTSIRFCSHPNVFGWHKLMYLRERVNARTNRTEIVEYPNPVIRLVLPEPKKSIVFGFLDDTELYREMETEILANGHHKDIGKINTLVYKSNELKARLLDDIASLFVFIILVAILAYVPKLYCRFVYKPTMNYMLSSMNKRNLFHIPDTETYHVFLAHSDEDYPWISNVLVPRLENNLGLTVCLPDRNFNHGETIINATQRAVNDSKIILICLTDSYLNDPGCYRLQVEHLLLPNLYYDKERSNYKIVVLNFKGGAIPQPLRWNSDIVVIHWKCLPENERFKMLDTVVKQAKCDDSQNKSWSEFLKKIKMVLQR